MFRLNAYSGRDIQNFKSLLLQFKKEGIIDIKSIQVVLNKYMDDLVKSKQLKDYRVYKEAQKANNEFYRVRRNMIREPRICPDCINGRLNPIHKEDNMIIWACKQCRYSEMKEDTNVK